MCDGTGAVRNAYHRLQCQAHLDPALLVSMSSYSVIGTILFGAVVLYLLTRRSHHFFADHSPIMSPDTVSSLFPDRPIRPLPKRRLRDQLSPEVADTIKCPTSSHENAPLFYYPPYSVKDQTAPSAPGPTSPAGQGRRNEPGRNYTPRRNGVGLSDGDEDEPASRSTVVTRSPPEILTRATRRPSRLDQARHPNPQAPPSTTSSLDACDFENSNNKKKRKIPSPSDLILSTHALNSEISSLAISSQAHSPGNEVNGERPHSHLVGNSASGSSMAHNQGMSGPGRGRLGRARNGRSPLRALSDGSNSWTGRTSKPPPPQWASTEHESTGIISNAIANAEKLGPQGQENVSLLQQHTAGTVTPASTHFTFTCDSQVPGTVRWPGESMGNKVATQRPPAPPPPDNGGRTSQADGPLKANGGSGNSPKTERRQLEKELKIAARHRRRLAGQNYFANPPAAENIWICEFCEYQRIFGEPPRALIRKYELNARRHTQEEVDRKRLLEKAKAKSRKARRTGKTSTRGSQAQQQPPQDQDDSLADHSAASMEAQSSHSTHSEGADYGDGSVEEYPDPPPAIPPDLDPTVRQILRAV
ncbi:hypothetical protein B0T10DRAFT_456428 [Thelonectria olida]|uniref:Uncharacterized protein n=1 Tax=Thelonectria olida TaxID=1576542 RepID=A0A9P9AS79_9HYPO|nr:hypothetical protein B0T10DRAFT_456428 [Thelonectria olida]